MKVAIIGSRSLNIDISKYVPDGTTVIISGGAKGIDTLAEAYAHDKNIPEIIIRPDYDSYGKTAPLERNKMIVDIADIVVALWDGKSRGTKHAIDYALERRKIVRVYIISKNYCPTE